MTPAYVHGRGTRELKRAGGPGRQSVEVFAEAARRLAAAGVTNAGFRQA